MYKKFYLQCLVQKEHKVFSDSFHKWAKIEDF
jgi:hypothetical protein